MAMQLTLASPKPISMEMFIGKSEMKQRDLYDKICRLLTEYEQDLDGKFDEHQFYEVLCEVVNAWEDLTSEK